MLPPLSPDSSPHCGRAEASMDVRQSRCAAACVPPDEETCYFYGCEWEDGGEGRRGGSEEVRGERWRGSWWMSVGSRAAVKWSDVWRAHCKVKVHRSDAPPPQHNRVTTHWLKRSGCPFPCLVVGGFIDRKKIFPFTPVSSWIHPLFSLQFRRRRKRKSNLNKINFYWISASLCPID